MSVSSLMSTGVRAMVANYAALQTTGHNIANAGVDGYSRQSASFAPAEGMFTGSGYIGRGVDLQTIQRTRDNFLLKEAQATQSVASMEQARLGKLEELESVFPIGAGGLGQSINRFLDASVDVANDPSDMPTRQVMLARAQDTAGQFAQAGNQLDTIQRGVTETLGNQVSEINGLARSIASMNKRVVDSSGSGQPPNDLLDERDRLVGRLSELVQVSTIPATDGSLGVFVNGGQRLVLGMEASTLSVVKDDTDPSRSAVAISDGKVQRTLPAASFTGGSVGGLLAFQNEDLSSARARLGQMAVALAGAVNTQQSLGRDLQDTPAAGAPIFSVGGPRSVPALSNARDGAGNPIANVSMTVVDTRQLQGSEYDLRTDPSGAWQLTRQSDGYRQTVTDGQVVDGFRLSLGTPAPAASDHFTLQPVSMAASQMKVVLSDPRGLAAALPVTGTVGDANAGTASIASLTVTDPAIDATATTTITFSSSTGTYGWLQKDAAGNPVASATGLAWTPGQPIAVNGFALQLDGVPADGDTFTVAPTPYNAFSNGNALAMADLRDLQTVGTTGMAAGKATGGANFTDAYASVIGEVGVRVQQSKTASSIADALATDAKQRETNASGVNLDEEAARLIAYQQNYQASAKILTVAQTLFDTLLQATNG